MMKQPLSTEVLIVGAGPTGLMMACQLALHRISFRIIDQNTGSSQYSGALIVQGRTLEILEQLGIAKRAINEGVIANRIDILYNGKKIAGTSIKDIGGNLSQFPFLLMLEQSKTEKLLLEFLEDYGCNVERNIQFKGFAQDNEIITTEVMMPNGLGQKILSKYLIGADGSHSAVRNFLNIPFKGKRYSRPIFVIDCEAESDICSDAISFAFSGKSVAGFFPLRNQRWRVDGSYPERSKKSKTLTLDDITKGFQNWYKLNFLPHHTEWFSVSHSQQKYTRNIRIGNCFFAGDSAHVNTPVGAQGMNTGLQDSHNLAWKLAFVIKQKAKPELLESYTSERLGISKRFAPYADAIYRIATNKNWAFNLFRTFALKIFFKRIFPRMDKKRYRLSFYKSISQINIHYKPAFGSYKNLEKRFSHGTPKPGFRMPYLNFIFDNKNINSHQILNASIYTLIVLAEALPFEIQLICRKYSLAGVLIKHLPETDIVYKSLGIKVAGFYLIRPDMYIELRSATLDTKDLNDYLHQLFFVNQDIGLL